MPPAAASNPVSVEERASATVRLAGDAGDGIHLAGSQFSRTSALTGNVVPLANDKLNFRIIGSPDADSGLTFVKK